MWQVTYAAGHVFLGVLQEVLGLGPSKSKGLGKMLHIYICNNIYIYIYNSPNYDPRFSYA